MPTKTALRFVEEEREVFRMECLGMIPVPSRGDFVNLIGDRYQVYDLEWIYDQIGPVITLQVSRAI